MDVFMPYSAVSHHHTLSGLKQRKFTVMQFWRTASNMGLIGLNSRC